MNNYDFDSPYYPYRKVISGADTFKTAELIPKKLLTYLLDLPDSNGYQPTDDNTRARVRLAKYLYYDEANPLSQSLPTPAQKLSMLYDADNPVINTDELKEKHPKGYRLLWQKLDMEAALSATTVIKCFIGRIQSPSPFTADIGVRFEISVGTAEETNTKTNAYARSFDLEQCLREALSGVAMAGIGVISFARGDHADNGRGIMYDEGNNVGRWVHCSISWAESNDDTINAYFS